MVAFDQVDDGEVLTAVQLGGEILYGGKGVAVRAGAGVETAVVAAGAPGPILLGHHM